MKITFLGHSGFRIEIGDQVLLIDPWLRGNPTFDEDRFDEAIEGATHILVSHAHDDHASNAVEIAKKTGAPVVTIFDLAGLMGGDAVEGIGLNKGGTVSLGNVEVTMVHAIHSSTFEHEGRQVSPGNEVGFMIAGEGKTIYFAGDTDVMSDMALFQDLHAPQIGILPIGGRFTMDAKRAAYACNRFFEFETIIPCHYGTFELLAQSADEFVGAVEKGAVKPLEVMGSVEL